MGSFHISDRLLLERAQRTTTKMVEEMEQMYCVERLNRLGLERQCLRGDKIYKKIYKILKRADNVGEELFYPS